MFFQGCVCVLCVYAFVRVCVCMCVCVLGVCMCVRGVAEVVTLETLTAKRRITTLLLLQLRQLLLTPALINTPITTTTTY
jgi:hypothetical protein